MRTEDCSSVTSSGPSDLIKFLKTEASKADPACVAQAITRLGDSRSPSGVEVLVDLLDYKRPASIKEKYHLSDSNDTFPAVPALFSIGMPAVPGLLAALQSGRVSGAARSNGIRVIAAIYRDTPPKAIKILKEAASTAKNSEDATRLESCAKDAIAFCSENWHARCLEELKSSGR